MVDHTISGWWYTYTSEKYYRMESHEIPWFQATKQIFHMKHIPIDQKELWSPCPFSKPSGFRDFPWMIPAPLLNMAIEIVYGTKKHRDFPVRKRSKLLVYQRVTSNHFWDVLKLATVELEVADELAHRSVMSMAHPMNRWSHHVPLGYERHFRITVFQCQLEFPRRTYGMYELEGSLNHCIIVCRRSANDFARSPRSGWWAILRPKLSPAPWPSVKRWGRQPMGTLGIGRQDLPKNSAASISLILMVGVKYIYDR